MNIEEFKRWAKLKCMELIIEGSNRYTFVSNIGIIFTVVTNKEGNIHTAYGGE
jgi:predicted regulator of Ras-like GTPase activity (Roadblock/LC7/MglB family)